MYKRLKKTAAIILAASMLFQSGLQGIAGETNPTETVTETASETETEKETVKETETSAPETQTQAQTETVPETPKETETPKATEAPATEAPTETAKATEAPKETETPKATEAPKETETARETETSSGETETETDTEKETKKETEKSERKNTGDKITASGLASGLSSALPYLFAAGSINAPDELLEGQSVSTAGAGALKGFSLKLANGQSSSDVTVVNIYADKSGKLDTAQLKGQSMDVTSRYYVVNIIADSASQALSFSGYGMVQSGGTLVYEDETQPGKVLYNFAALVDGKYTDYKGSLTLSNGSGLQGTFLAPSASVSVASSLAGAVYAGSVTVSETVQELKQIVLVNGRSASDVPAQTAESGETAPEEAASEKAGELTDTEEMAQSGEDEGTEAAEENEISAGIDLTIDIDESAASEAESDESESSGESLTEEQVIDMAEMGTADSDMTETDSDMTETDSDMTETDSDMTETDSDMTETDSDMTETEELQVVLATLTVKAVDSSGVETGDPISDVVFVIKDSEGNVITDESGNAMFTLSYPGEEEPLPIYGLTSGTEYILSQISTISGYDITEDIAFTAGTEEAPTALAVEIEKHESGPVTEEKSVTVTAQASYNGVVLTSDKDLAASGSYVAVFRTRDGVKTRISPVQQLAYAKDSTTSQFTFEGIEVEKDVQGDVYTVEAVDQYGVIMTSAGQYQAASQTLTFTEEAGAAAELPIVYNVYPENNFYYMAPVQVTAALKDGDAEAFATTFYAQLFTTEDASQAVAADPAVFTFAFDSTAPEATAVSTANVKMLSASATYYLAEIDAVGKVLTTSAEFPYGIEIAPSGLEIFCEADEQTGLQKTVTASITNTLNPTGVTISATNSSGKHISGVTMVIKNSKGKIVTVDGSSTFISKDSDIAVTGLTTGETYYLSEVAAPSGYAPCADVAFTVQRGVTANVTLKHTKATTTNYKISAVKQVYADGAQVYARDTTSGTYAAKGQYTFYFALFSDSAHTQKVSNVQAVTVSGFSGTTTFSNLTRSGTYYIAETNEYGEPLTAAKTLSTGSSSVKGTISYTNSGRVKVTSTTNTTTIQNIYTSLPAGYRYTASLTISKKVTDAAGAAKAVSSTFYAGIFRTANYSDTPTIVKLELKNASTVSVKRRILLSGTKSAVYYIAEVDSSGKRLTDSSSSYSVSIDNPTVTLSKDSNKTVTITNKEKDGSSATDSKVTLYITKQVYQGTAKKNTTATFYAGLFKDKDFTEPYTKPIPLTLSNKSEVTLKLSLNIGSAETATIYVAEVDSNGKVIKDEEDFGYNIRMVNSTATFTATQRSVQSILINSVYGTTSNNNWQKIMHSNDWDDDDSISSNGTASATTASTQTGDNTPVGWYLLLMGAAFVVLLGGVGRKILRKS